MQRNRIAFSNAPLKDSDREIWDLIKKERSRQRNGVELIASENFVSKAVMEALGSCLTNKYSEGLPYARYYGGNKYIDQLESLCQKRVLSLFGLDSLHWSVNVQPYSGSPANFAVYTALLQPRDRIMGLDLPSGGHLTHGYKTNKKNVSATSIFFDTLPYYVDASSGLIDYDGLAKAALQFQPRLIIAGASAYPRDWDYARMRIIADSVGAYLMADIAHISGLVATRQCNSPFEHCDVITSTTHKTLRGPRSGMIICKQHLSKTINSAVFPALQGGPHNHQIAALAVALHEASQPSFSVYIKQVIENAASLADAMMQQGYIIVTNGTDNHLVLWDVRPTGLNGAIIEKLSEICEISVNKNAIIGDHSAMSAPGGVRLGTSAVTTRGMKQKDMYRLVDWLHRIVLIGQDIKGNIITNAMCTANTSLIEMISLKTNNTSLPRTTIGCNGNTTNKFVSTIRSDSNSCDPTKQQHFQQEPVSLKKFLDMAAQLPYVEQLLQIKTEVESFSIQFPLPGIDIEL